MDRSKNFVITINRELGSGGRTIGRKLADRLGVQFFDKAAIEGLCKHFNLSVEDVERLKARKTHWWDNISNVQMNPSVLEHYDELPMAATSQNMFKVETAVLKNIAEEESCVVAGRTGFVVFKDHPNSFRILIESTLEERMARIMRKQNLSEDEALDVIKRVDEGREHYVKKFAKTSRYDARNYDLVLNVAQLTEDQVVDIIMYVLDK